jgi:uncharacterized integral membrane protein
METINQNSEQYQCAKNQVKKLKGFYGHLAVYIIVNSILLVLVYKNLDQGQNFFSFGTFSTAIFWGIGLLSHATSVFGKDLIFNKKWEEIKIQEFMGKDKKSNWE